MLNYSFLRTTTRLKSELCIASYDLPNLFGHYQSRATLVHLIRTIPKFLNPRRFPNVPTSTTKFHPLSNPMMELDPHLTHKLKRNSTFDTLALNTSFYFYMHILRSPEILISRRSLKSRHIAPAFGLSTKLHPKPQESRTPEGSTLTRGGVLNEKERIGGFQLLYLQNRPSKYVPRG